MATTGNGRLGSHRQPSGPARPGRTGWLRSRRAGVIAAALGTVIGVVVAIAVTGGAGAKAPADALNPAPSTPGSRSGRASARGARAFTFCQVKKPASLRADLSQAVPGSDRSEMQPLGVTDGGRKVFLAEWTNSFSGVAEMSLASGKTRDIKAFPDPSTDQADGASSGNWLVWAQTYSTSDLDRFTMLAWDATTGTLHRIGHSLAGRRGKPYASPWHAPAVSGHYAAWAQGYGSGGLVEVRLANLATGTVTTIRTGHTQPPFFDGDLVVWPESDTPGSQTTLRAYSLTRHRLVPLPAALRGVHGTEFVATDGTRTAYLSPDMTQLYYSPRPDQPARLALRLPAGDEFADLVLSPGALAWTTSAATYLASTRTGAFTRVTRQYGYATGSSSVVLVTDGPSQKAVHPALPLHVVRPSAVSWPTC